VKISRIVISIVLLALVAVALYGLHLEREGFSARKQPSALETFVARTMRNASIPRSARTEENPWKDLATPANLKEAQEHFADHCAQCHGNDGRGNTDMGQNMYPKPPDMRLAATQNLSDGELYYIIENGVRLTGMPAWGDPNFIEQDDDSWKLVLFIRHLPHQTPEEIKDMESYNPKGKMETEDEEEHMDMPHMDHDHAQPEHK
jgi:mono/diheme cytochrome c family protein